MKIFLAFFSETQFCFYLIPCVTEDKNCKYWIEIMQAVRKQFAFITYCKVTKSPVYIDSLLSGCYLSVSPHAGLCLYLTVYDTCKERKKERERLKERERRGVHAVKGRQMGLSVMYIVTHLPVTAPWECGIINTEKWKVGIKHKKNKIK